MTNYWLAYKPNHPENYLFLSRLGNPLCSRAVQKLFLNKVSGEVPALSQKSLLFRWIGILRTDKASGKPSGIRELLDTSLSKGMDCILQASIQNGCNRC